MKTRSPKPSVGFHAGRAISDKRLPSCAASLWVLAAGGVLAFGGAVAAPPLPAPGTRISPVAVPTGAATQARVATINGTPVYSPQVVSGGFGAYQVTPTATDAAGAATKVTATVTQTGNSGILQWSKFDIGSQATVNIVQPSSQSVLLNKVSGGDFGGRTLIEGALNANGQVYIYNAAGLVFGKTAVIDVNTLVGTTLKIDDARFTGGLLAPNANPQFALDTYPAGTVDSDGTTVVAGRPLVLVRNKVDGSIATILPSQAATVDTTRFDVIDTSKGAIRVEGESIAGVRQQALIKAGTGGRVLLMAPNVSNDGAIQAPDGQVVLAGGGKVYLASPADSSMRGLLVEVNNDFTAGINTVSTDSTAVNGALGTVNVGRGNASMVAHAVNQNGLVSATTAVSLNGSIWLSARDGAVKNGDGSAVALAFGALELGPDSKTQVLPDTGDTTTSTAATTFNPSEVRLSGKTVTLKANASVVATGGNVSVEATGAGNRIQLDSGAAIDVSGSKGTQLAMESNVIAVELRGAETADNPLLRDSPLRSQTVYVDKRVGTPIANVQGWLDLVEYGIGERTAAGGTVALRAVGGSVQLGQGSNVDVSGGQVNYKAGSIVTSKLVADGKLYDIGSAPSDRLYTSQLDIKATPGVAEAAYVDGRSAGTLIVDSATARLDGALAGQVTVGARQRLAGTVPLDANGKAVQDGNRKNLVARPHGGTLVIGNETTHGDIGRFNEFDFADSVTLSNNGTRSASGLNLDLGQLGAAGFGNVSVYTQHGIRVATGGNGDTLAAGGQLNLSAVEAIGFDAGSTVRVASGTVVAASRDTINVGEGTSVDLAGRWTNDRAALAPRDAAANPVAQIATAGGSVSLAAPKLVIGAGASFDVSGGAWQNSTGTLAAGNGGSIKLLGQGDGSVGPLSVPLAMGSGVSFAGYGAYQGGSLRIDAGQVRLKADNDASAPADASTVDLRESFFRTGGFTSYDIRAFADVRAQAANLAPQAANWVAGAGTRAAADGRMESAFSVGVLPLADAPLTRRGSNLSLTAATALLDNAGLVMLDAGSSISVDPGASVSLAAGRQIRLEGRATANPVDPAASITAHGGAISLGLTQNIASDASYRADNGVSVGAGVVLDASGSTARLGTDGRGATTGALLDGGSISIGGAGGTAIAGKIAVAEGAKLDVGGVATSVTVRGDWGLLETREIASAGGSITVRARDGIVLAGTVNGAGGNASARGGSLTVGLDRQALQEVATDASSVPTGSLDLRVLATGATSGAQAGRGIVRADAINAGKFDWVNLGSSGSVGAAGAADSVTFDVAAGSMTLSPRAGLTVNAPAIAATGATASSHSTVTLAAPYVQLGNTNWANQSAAAAAAGAAPVTLAVNASSTLDLAGQSALQGFNRAILSAAGDVRMVGQVGADVTQTPSTLTALHATGRFTVAGNLDIAAAQVYPTTLSEFTLAATGAGATVSVSGNKNSAAAPVPLSAAGTLSVEADNITQNGTVRAPLGRIAFNAASTLAFGAGSVTSVAGEGTLPLGQVKNGRDWVYDFGAGNLVNLGDATGDAYVGLPEKGIAAKGANVTVAATAKLDASGGGSPFAYEFTAGPGGSKDVMASTTARPVFAVVRDFTGTVAPRDAQYGQDGGFKVGDSIYLAGGAGLPAGTYTLLPAHYALLANGYLVTPQSGRPDMPATSTVSNPDGSAIVSGYRIALGGGADNRRSGFLVAPQSVLLRYSQINDYAGAALPGVGASLGSDGGHVSIDGTAGLVLNGGIALRAASGRAGSLDIAAPEIAVVADATRARPTESGAGATLLNADQLAGYGADSLLLGGVRSFQSTSDVVSVRARQVVVDGATLQAPEIVLAAAGSGSGSDPADGRVLVKAGSRVLSSGAPGHVAAGNTLTMRNAATPAQTNPDGAVLRVSGGAQATIDRGAPVKATGNLDIRAGAIVGDAATDPGATSIALDATNLLRQGGTLKRGDGSALAVSSGTINLGQAIPALAKGASFDAAAAKGLDGFASVRLVSYGSIDTYGNVDLGSLVVDKDAAGTPLRVGEVRDANGVIIDPGKVAVHASIGNLSLTGSKLQALAAAGGSPAVNVVADTILVAGNGGSATAGAAAAGTLTMQARDIVFGSGTQELAGFAGANLNASGEVRLAGTAGGFNAGGDATVSAGRVVATSGASGTLKAAGNLVVTTAGPTLATVAAPGSTGRLTLAAGTLAPAGGLDVALAAGDRLAWDSTAAASTAAAAVGGSITLAGNTVRSDAAISARAGNITLSAANGVSVTGGTLDASGQSVAFGSGVAYAPGGTITLNGGAGNVRVEQAATLDVSATGADAGTIAVTASNAGKTGQAALLGRLKGDATAGSDGATPAQGSFTLDVDVVAADQGFGALNGKLNWDDKLKTGGFTAARDFRVRSGDLALAGATAGTAAESIVARSVTIAADNGKVTIGGTVDASGAKGGSIRIYAAEASAGRGTGKVVLESGAVLDASATAVATGQAGSTGDGGSIVIGSAIADGGVAGSITDANIDIAAGARLNVSAAGPLGQGGSVVLRAPRLAATAGNVSDVAVSKLAAANIVGSASTTIEGVKVYAGKNVTVTANADSGTATSATRNLSATTTGQMFTESTGFTNGPALARLGLTGSTVALTPGLEVRSEGSLNVSVNEAAATASMGTRGWNLSTWRFKGQPVALTLRAGGDLVIAGSISDGFVPSTTFSMQDWRLATAGRSASYRLVGGADATAANPLAVKIGTTAGDVKLTFASFGTNVADRPVALVRTGTGSIDVAAGRDVVLDTLWYKSGGGNGSLISASANGFAGVDFTKDTLLGAAIYTAGVASNPPDPAQFTAPLDTPNAGYRPATTAASTVTAAQFGESGGAISLRAARNVVGSPTAQLVNNWLFRQGAVDATGAFATDAAQLRLQATAWWTRPDYFNQGVATFAGGDISVAADSGRVTDLAASVATNAYLPGGTPVAGALVERGGGDLRVRAGSDIQGGSFYVQEGTASLRAGGAISAGTRKVADPSQGPGVTVTLRPILAVGDAQFNLTAARDVQIEGAFNPMMGMQSGAFAPTGTTSPNGSRIGNVSANPNLSSTTIYDQLSFFSTYSPASAMRLTSLSGNVALGENANALYAAGGGNSNAGNASAPISQLLPTSASQFLQQYLLMPGTVNVAALGGDVNIEHGFSMAPAATGQLNLFANGSVKATGAMLKGVSQPIVMIDRDPASMPNPLSPRTPAAGSNDDYALRYAADGIAFHAAGGLHAADPDPARVVALTGDIDFSVNRSFPTMLVIPKPLELSAGRDLVDVGFRAQNLATGDVTRVSAGRDLKDSTYSTGIFNPVTHIVTGPGRIDVQVGRNVDLGNGSGIQTRANLDNPYLPAQGAGIDVVAGAVPDYAGFAGKYVAAGDLPAADRADLQAYVRRVSPALAAGKTATAEAAWDAFNQDLTAAQRQAFLDARKPLFDALFFQAQRKALAVGEGAGGVKNSGLFDAIVASMFPADKRVAGDINVFGSQLRTERGGAITTYASGGSFYAGLADQPLWLTRQLRDTPTLASRLGVFTVGGGAIQGMVLKKYAVNQGRVFTLGGGDITLAASGLAGDQPAVEAGKGTKTAVSAPPPLITTDKDGNTRFDVTGTISGSGIATLRTSPSVAASDIFVMVPHGSFDAGDAGVRSSGKVGIDATTVFNANNIAASSGVSGAKAADSGSTAPAAAPPAAAPPPKTDNFAAAAANPDAASTLTVDLLGYGTTGSAAPRPPSALPAQANAPVEAVDTDAEAERRRRSRQ